MDIDRQTDTVERWMDTDTHTGGLTDRWMNVYIYIYIYTHTYTYKYIYIHIYTHTHTHVEGKYRLPKIKIHGWMDGWMHGCMHGWLDR